MTELTKAAPVPIAPRRALLRLVAVAVLAAACAAVPSDGPVALRTAQLGPVCQAARLSGTLVADSTYGLALKSGGTVTGVVWPDGYSASRASGLVALIDPAGQFVAKEGDFVVAGGAEGADGLSHPCFNIHVETPPSS